MKQVGWAIFWAIVVSGLILLACNAVDSGHPGTLDPILKH